MADERQTEQTQYDSNHNPSVQGNGVVLTANYNGKCGSDECRAQQKTSEAKELEGIKAGERWLIIVGAASVILNFLIFLVYYGQLTQMQAATNMAATSVEIAAMQTRLTAKSISDSTDSFNKTLGEMKTQSGATNRLAGEAKRQADIATDMLHLDQRAWVGFAGAETIGGTQSEDGETFSFKGVRIAIRNSGKTPATNVVTVIMQTSLDRREKIGDYDSVTADLNRRREEELSKIQEEEIRRHPELADRIRDRDKDMRDREREHAPELFPEEQVIAPGVVLTHNGGGASYGIRGDQGFGHKTIYILGKITYHDVFKNTTVHTTKFCLMRQGGTQFVPCPTGNSMN